MTRVPQKTSPVPPSSTPLCPPGRAAWAAGPALACLLLCWGAGIAARASTTGADFLRAQIPARPASLGGAYAASAGDAVSFLWNPASLGSLRQPMVSATHFSSIIDTSYELATYAQPLYTLPGAFGGMVQYSSTSDFYQTDSQGNNVGLIANYDLVLGADYGLALSDRFAAGLGLKGFTSRLQDFQSRGFAVDLGMQSLITDSVVLGIALQNLGRESAYDQVADPLPTMLRIGFEGGLVDTPENRLAWSAEVERPWNNTDPVVPILAGEYEYLRTLAFRVGYRFNTDLGNLALGAGFRRWGASFDYAYAPFGDLGFTQRFTLSLAFGTLLKSLGPGQGGPSPAPAPRAAPQKGGTRVSGLLGGDEVWDASHSPYLVSGDLVVPRGVTLYVEPGVELRFLPSAPGASFRADTTSLRSGLANLVVQGKLWAVGTASRPVVFDGPSGSDGRRPQASWGSLIFDAGSDPDCRLEYARVAGGSVILTASSPTFSRCRFTDAPIQVGFLSAPQISYCELRDADTAVEVLTASSDLGAFDHNLVTGNRDGLYLRDFSRAIPRACTFAANREYDIMNYSMRTVDARFNSWGGRDPEEIRAALYDHDDNSDSGPVLVTPTAQ